MKYILTIILAVHIINCKNDNKQYPTMIISLTVKDKTFNIPINDAFIIQKSISESEGLVIGSTNKNGFSYDTVKHVMSFYRRSGLGPAPYYPDSMIISINNYKADTVKLISYNEIDPISYFESLGDSTVKIDLGVIYLEPLK